MAADDQDQEETTSLVARPADAEPPDTRRGSVVVLASADKALIGRQFRIEPGVLVVGRGEDAQIRVEDQGISRRHARLRCLDGRYAVEDLASTNGLFLNGRRVTDSALAHGDKLTLGTSTVLGFSLQDELEENLQRSLYESATRDALTGLLNRRAVMDALAVEFAYGIRHRASVSVIVADVDRFKAVNDTHGHQAGDRVLAGVAQALGAATRTEDRVGRHGGEEFIVILRETAPDAAFRCAERCRAQVAASVFLIGEARVAVTISLGVATLGPAGPASPEELIALADRRLYAAKEGGRDRTIGGPDVAFESAAEERRLHARIDADLACHLVTPTARAPGRVRDVSMAGALLVGPPGLAAPGGPLGFELDAVDGQGPRTLLGSVAWSRPQGAEAGYGLLLEHLGVEERGVLDALMRELVAAPGPGTRQHPRIRRRAELRVRGSAEVSVVMRDISRGGVGFTSDTEVQVGESICLELNLGSLLSQAMVLSGEVTNVTPAEGGRFQVGLRFAPLDAAEQQIIDDVLRLLVARRTGGALGGVGGGG